MRQTPKKKLHELPVNNVNQTSQLTGSSILPEIENEQFKEYKNFQFFDIRTAMILLLMVMFIFTCIKNGSEPNGWFVVVIVALALFRLLIWLTYYFKLSDHFLVIRNHNVFWYKKIYFLSDIRSIIFETPGKEIYRMRVITNDFESEIFYGVSLWKKQWRALREDLKDKGIVVIDEFIFEKVEYEFTVFDELGWFKKKK